MADKRATMHSMAPKAASEPVGCLHAPAEWPNPNYMHLCTIATSVCNGCQNSTAMAKPAAHFFWPIQPSNMLDTTTLSLYQPFPSCKVKKFFN